MNSENRAQLYCAGILPDLITQGVQDCLPSLVWVIGMDGMTGKVDGLPLDLTPAQHREAFDGWVKVLGAEVEPEKTSADGYTYLTAARYFTSKRIVVVLRATVASPMNDSCGSEGAAGGGRG